MFRTKMRMVAVAVSFVGVSYSGLVTPGDGASDSNATFRVASPIEGLWSGTWGGGQSGGVVLQPALAELLVEGDQAVLHGFRGASSLAGTVRIDGNTRRLQITLAAEAGGQAAPSVVGFIYNIKGDELTLTDRDGFSIALHKQPVAHDPLANAQAEFVAAEGVSDAGDLLVTVFTVLRSARAGATYFQPEKRSLKTTGATVLFVQQTGLKTISVEEARGQIRGITPVLVAYRHDDRPSPHQLHELWKDVGPPMPDSEAVCKTFARVLRPGTLVFILSARANVPEP